MIVGEGPGADEDRQGLPFVGRAGQLLDRMFAAIGLSRRSPDAESALYITNTVPWRPPGNREPTPEELAMLKPFLMRHIELAQPDVLVAMGNVACDALLGRRGILKLRGTWAGAADDASRLSAQKPRGQARGLGGSSVPQGAAESGRMTAARFAAWPRPAGAAIFCALFTRGSA